MKQKGFSLMELMVVMGIMTLITVMSFADYPALRQKMSLKRTSEDVALIVRQAQSYALGVKKPDSSGFGVHFDKNANNSKSLIIFADNKNGNNKTYDIGESFEEYKINTGDYIFGLNKCDSNNTCSSLSILDIFYPRATSMAIINNDSNMSYATVTIKSPGGATKSIKIWTSGSISVE